MKRLFTPIAISTAVMLGIASCNPADDREKQKEGEKTVIKDTVPAQPVDSPKVTHCTNDSLNELAEMIAGIDGSGKATVLKKVFEREDFKTFSANFNKRWSEFDSSRLQKLVAFRDAEITPKVGHTKTLFYPFSGPDILYGYTFFPDADKYIMLGLEPIGTRPVYDSNDSLKNYFAKVNTSLNAILKFSFFRTESMKSDLRNEELDGTIHLLLLFLSRTGNSICAINPVYIDSSGTVQQLRSFPALKENKKLLNKGIEIHFTSQEGKAKSLYYFSLNIANSAVQQNPGMLHYLDNLGEINTYLKGASYLMHKSYFSVVRDAILKNSQHVIQDDSGISFHYFGESGHTWNYTLYGSYTHPIPMFKEFYQKDLDSLYKAQGSKSIGFGIGYNFKDKNSNFMIASRSH